MVIIHIYLFLWPTIISYLTFAHVKFILMFLHNWPRLFFQFVLFCFLKDEWMCSWQERLEKLILKEKLLADQSWECVFFFVRVNQNVVEAKWSIVAWRWCKVVEPNSCVSWEKLASWHKGFVKQVCCACKLVLLFVFFYKTDLQVFYIISLICHHSFTSEALIIWSMWFWFLFLN